MLRYRTSFYSICCNAKTKPCAQVYTRIHTTTRPDIHFIPRDNRHLRIASFGIPLMGCVSVLKNTDDVILNGSVRQKIAITLHVYGFFLYVITFISIIKGTYYEIWAPEECFSSIGHFLSFVSLNIFIMLPIMYT